MAMELDTTQTNTAQRDGHAQTMELHRLRIPGECVVLSVRMCSSAYVLFSSRCRYFRNVEKMSLSGSARREAFQQLF